MDAEVETESIQQNTVLDSFLATQPQITAAMYADEFNIDLAQAINELETLCKRQFRKKTHQQRKLLRKQHSYHLFRKNHKIVPFTLKKKSSNRHFLYA